MCCFEYVVIVKESVLLIEGECACFCVFVSSFGYPTITHTGMHVSACMMIVYLFRVLVIRPSLTRMHVSACMMQIPTAYISVYEN